MEDEIKQNSNDFSFKVIFGISLISLLVDAATVIPFVGDFLGPLYWVSISYYFWRKGLGIVNWRRFAPTIISFIGELIPVVQSFPTIFASTIAIFTLTKLENKIGVEIVKKPSLKIGKKPLNNDGVRMPKNRPIDIDLG